MTWTPPGVMSESKRQEQRSGRGTQGGSSQLVDPYPAGQGVRVELVPGQERFGEVVCWDPASKVILIRSPIPNEPFKTRLHVINMSHITSIDVLTDQPPSSQPPPLPNVDLQKQKRKLERELQKRERSFITVDVSPLGQKLFFAIQRTIEDVRWEEDRLVVMGDVEIKPPYSVEDVRPLGDEASHPSTAASVAHHVRRVMHKMEAAEVGVSGADPAILSASMSSSLPPSAVLSTSEAGDALPRSASDDGAAFVDAPEELPLPNPISA